MGLGGNYRDRSFRQRQIAVDHMCGCASKQDFLGAATGDNRNLDDQAICVRLHCNCRLAYLAAYQ